MSSEEMTKEDVLEVLNSRPPWARTYLRVGQMPWEDGPRWFVDPPGGPFMVLPKGVHADEILEEMKE